MSTDTMKTAKKAFEWIIDHRKEIIDALDSIIALAGHSKGDSASTTSASTEKGA